MVGTSDKEWQPVTTNDNKWNNEWQQVVQRVTTSENKWQWVITNDSEWQWMKGSGYNEWKWMRASKIEWFKFHNETKG